MQKLVLFFVMSLLLLGLPTTAQAGTGPSAGAGAPASRARVAVPRQGWTPWAYSPSSEGDFTGLCTESVHVSWPVDRVKQRSRLVPGGNTEIQSKGRLVVALTPASQPNHHYTFDVSGPSVGAHSQISYVNGDYLYRATGANILPAFGTAVDNSGLPRLAYTKGAVGVLYTGRVKGDVITRPKTVIDLCKYMGLDSAP